MKAEGANVAPKRTHVSEDWEKWRARSRTWFELI